MKTAINLREDIKLKDVVTKTEIQNKFNEVMEKLGNKKNKILFIQEKKEINTAIISLEYLEALHTNMLELQEKYEYYRITKSTGETPADEVAEKFGMNI